MKRPRTERTIGGMSKGVVSQHLDTMETGADTDNTRDLVHELRSHAEEILDHTVSRLLIRLKGAWEQRLSRTEDYMGSHPWMVLGGLLLLGYLFSGSRRLRQSSASGSIPGH